MVIPDTFGTRGEKVISSYDYYDIAEGTGIEIFYLATARDSSATLKKILTGNIIYADSRHTETAGGSGGSYAKTGDADFDLSEFNLPKTVKGMAIVNIGWGVEGNSNSQGSTNAYLIIKVRKWDGSTETEIGSGKTETINGPGPAGSFTGTISTVEIDCTQTHFKKGDILRVTVENWTILGSGSSGGSVHIGHDPMNNDSDLMVPGTNDIITKTTAHIPFKLNL